MEHIGTALNRLQQEAKIPQESVKKVLEAYSHVELTEDELDEVILWAKRKKEAKMEYEFVKEREAKNRKLLSGNQWSFAQTESFMTYRASQLFEKPFVIDKNNFLI